MSSDSSIATEDQQQQPEMSICCESASGMKNGKRQQDHADLVHEAAEREQNPHHSQDQCEIGQLEAP